MESNLTKEDLNLIAQMDKRLKKLETLLDEALAKETPETLTQWLLSKRSIAPIEQVEEVKFWQYIRCIYNVCSSLTIDKVYKVIKVDNDGCYVITDDGGNEFCYYPHRFDVATEAEYLSQQEQPKEEVKERYELRMFDIYFYIKEDFTIHSTKYSHPSLDYPRINSGNCFKTEQEAQSAATQIKALLQTL